MRGRIGFVVLGLVAIGIAVVAVVLLSRDDDDREALSPAEYETEILPQGEGISNQITSDISGLADEFGTDEGTAVLAGVADDVGEYVTTLEQVEPPATIATEHEGLIGAMSEVETGFRDAADASAANDIDAADDALGVAADNMDTAADLFDQMEVELGGTQ